ncbi:lipocalin family protein [bacterium]|nr:lipocalin family protein [bacterium]
MKLLSMFAIVTLFLVIACSKSSNEIPVVPKVDLNRYLGKWYEIATIPMRFQLGCKCVTAEYSLKENSRVKVVNSCRKGSPD